MCLDLTLAHAGELCQNHKVPNVSNGSCHSMDGSASVILAGSIEQPLGLTTIPQAAALITQLPGPPQAFSKVVSLVDEEHAAHGFVQALLDQQAE